MTLARGTDRGTYRGTEREVGRLVDLDISGAWLVDPAAGREGAADIVIESGRITSIAWLEGADADGIDDGGVVVAPGFIDLHAHLREPGGSGAETIASGLAAAAHVFDGLLARFREM